MKKQLFSILALTATILSAVATSPTPPPPSRMVNTLIGTSNYGVTHPGPAVPGGMVSTSPFNTIPHADHKIHTDGWCSTPYVFENKWVIGFTQVNLSGVGCPDLGSLLVMPTTGELEVDYRKYATTMGDIKAHAGYFQTDVNSKNGAIKTQMTATKRSTRTAFTFPSGNSHILFNIGKGLSTESGCSARIVSNNEIEGMRLMGDFCYGKPQSIIPIYFVVRTSKDAKTVKYWKKQPELPSAVSNWSKYSNSYKIYDLYKREMAGDEIGVAFSFDTEKDDQIEIQIGISYVSIENARENLETEQANKDFKQIQTEAENAWDKVLSVVDLEGGTHDQKVQFYTALYHNHIHPNVLNDVNGEYPAMVSGNTLNIANSMTNGQERLTMFSGWDVYRISPYLGSLFYPKRQNQMAESMMQMYRESGNLPKFEVLSQEFSVMEGDAALPYLTACYLLGLTKGIDTEELYQAMLKNAMGETPIRGKLDFYNKNHYIPLKAQYDNSVSQALELYVADYSLSVVAEKLGKTADAQMLRERAMGYKIYFDNNYGLLRPVLEDGKYMEGFDPLEGQNFESVSGFHEGTSWNYSFSTTFDTPGLIKLFGSKQRFVDSLENCFKKGYFDMGNEPDMGYPYLFTEVKGKEYLTQYWVNNCLNKYFKNIPAGLPGNDDAGTMSAWQNMSMMGIYPITPAKPIYTITTPTFDKVTIQLDPEYYNHKELVIEAINRTPENIYIDKVELDGKPYKSYFISHKMLTNAKKLTIYCRPTPKK